MTMGAILVVILIVMVLGAIPIWSQSSKWGYGARGGSGLILLITDVRWASDKEK